VNGIPGDGSALGGLPEGGSSRFLFIARQAKGFKSRGFRGVELFLSDEFGFHESVGRLGLLFPYTRATWRFRHFCLIETGGATRICLSPAP
jgi:hypothetical protein